MIFRRLLGGAPPLAFLGHVDASTAYSRRILLIACSGARSGFLLNSCFHVFSFRGDHRGLHMDRSGAPGKQAKSDFRKWNGDGGPLPVDCSPNSEAWMSECQPGSPSYEI